MTWASRSMANSVIRTRTFLRKQLWVWPIVAVLVLSLVGYFTNNLVETTIKGNLSSGLKSFVGIETEMLEKWFRVQKSNAQTLANSLPVRSVVYKMIAEQTEAAASEPATTSLDDELQTHLAPAMSSHDYIGYFVADRSHRILSASQHALVGQDDIPEYHSFLAECLEGKTVVSPPFASVVMLPDETGRLRVGQPTMYACAPLRDESFQVVGVLALQIRPEREFTGILQLGTVGVSGETYAFNEEGMMVSNSRFDEELMLLGILPDRENSRSILNVSLRDPGGNMLDGYRPQTRRSKLPLTRMAADAIAGNAAVDVEGYRDFRGVPVVGAWRWMPEYKIGVVTEISVAQAYRPLVILRTTFLALFGMLILSSIAIFAFTVLVSRLHREAQKAALKAQQLGQYTLEEQIGRGAMGVVYRGHHAMLRRPAAIKMLDIEKMNEETLARFEREVQITCQLNHPNTIAIYDYGRTPEELFYYAMEFIEGIDLQSLVTQYGPQPEARVIHILRQMCGSLYEAHSQGLVHRDIKPANTMIAVRGCVPDVVKVLDFGLVKSINDTTDKHPQNGLTGTPLYMSPEAIQSPLTVDACSDLYAVGAVGYFLITGRPVFQAETIAELCHKHLDDDPVSPSQLVSGAISPELEHAILSCLEKRRAKRPQTARDLAKLLEKCPLAHDWTTEDGGQWWSRHDRGKKRPSGVAAKAPVDAGPVTDQTMDQTIDQAGT